MGTYIGRLLLVGLALSAMACATPATQADQNGEIMHETIAAKAIYEDCTKAMPGQKIVYSFETSMPVHFNLHYHDEGEVNYGAFEKGVSLMRTTSYDVKLEQHYCLMWTNMHHMDVQLKYDYKVSD